ncbi:alpha/beta hydrolase [Naasia sp. SYSU D00948]|uniref:alpha/beta hydrolase n=1 Tax=Naasia sp. SYSU D00948 TaxID=2817379 RepID=UPI001B315FEB|nr:alpha/beta hydrolase [Naasia sp. SYSU D00948]
MLSFSALALALGATLAPVQPAPSLAVCMPSVISYEGSSEAPVLDAALARSLGPEALLRGIGELPIRDLRGFVDDNAQAVRELIAAPPSARAVETWWAALDRSEQAGLALLAPELIGNLDGVPYEVRDRANRAELASAQDELRSRLSSGIGKGAASGVIDRLKMLNQIEESLERTDGGPARRLIMLDTVMPGRAAVALGELEEADYVSLLVPGALLSVREHMAEWTKVTADIYDEQLRWGERLDEDFTVATVSWIGYQTPDVTNVAGLDLAEQGAAFLSSTVNGLRSLRDGDEPYVSVFAHSYGATAVMLALDSGDMSVDALAMMGSPGGVAETVADLGVPEGRVWVGEAAWDPVVHTAFFGVDPGSPEFGARRMSVAGSVDPVTGEVLTASVGHDWYLEPGTESLRNLSLIGIDEGQYVTDGSADPGTTLASER